MNAPVYQRLSRSYSWTGPTLLWAAEDHLLVAHSVGWAEVYKRFFLHDIEAIIIRKTALGAFYNGAWAALALFFALIAAQMASLAGPLVWSIPAVFVVGLLVNTAVGPTCECHIRTAVQTERIAALKRLRAARRTMHRVRPLIARAQGELTPARIHADLAGLQTTIGHAPPVIS